MSFNPSNYSYMGVKLSPIYFLRPEAVLRVYNLWKTNRTKETTHRTFVVSKINSHKPFIFMGAQNCARFCHDWLISEEQADFLRKLESLSIISDSSFWNFLKDLRVTGTVKAIPDGTVLGIAPVGVSEEVKKIQGDDPSMPLLTIEDTIPVVELISEALGGIISFYVENASSNYLRTKLFSPAPMFGSSEREHHPYWGILASQFEYIAGNRSIIDTPFSEEFWIMCKDNQYNRNALEMEQKILRHHAVSVKYLFHTLIEPTSNQTFI